MSLKVQKIIAPYKTNQHIVNFMCLGQTSSTVLSLLLSNTLTVKIAHQVLSFGRGGHSLKLK